MLNAGFIGFGRMGICHFAILNPHPDVQVVGVSDPSAIMRGIMKKYVTDNLGLFGDYREMLASKELDFVVISTPPSTHGEIVREAIRRGIHVFVEKPFCLDAKEGDELISELRKTNIITQVGYVNRFCETFTEARRIIEYGGLGRLISYSSEMYSATVIKETNSGWRSKKAEGGGCLYEMASHAIDLSRHLFGSPDTVSGSVLNKIYSEDVDDQVLTCFKHDDGVVGSLSVNWSDPSYRKPSNQLVGLFENAKLVVNKYGLRVFAKTDLPNLEFKAGWNTKYLTDLTKNVRFYARGNEFTEQLDHFVKSVINGSESITPFEEGHAVDLVIHAIKKNERMATDCRIDSILSDSMSITENQPSLWKRIRNIFKGAK